MHILHPFMPFITEEIYQQLQKQDTDLTVKQVQPATAPDPEIIKGGELLKEVITAIRDARNKAQLKPKDSIRLHIQTANRSSYTNIEHILARQVNAGLISFTENNIANCITVVVQKDRFFIETTTVTDNSSQREQMQKDLEYLKGFLASVEKKLSNERFVQNAKAEVVEAEKKKKADAEAKIKVIEESLGNS
jgi:valyl-tRNA synthetase